MKKLKQYKTTINFEPLLPYIVTAYFSSDVHRTVEKLKLLEMVGARAGCFYNDKGASVLILPIAADADTIVHEAFHATMNVTHHTGIDFCDTPGGNEVVAYILGHITQCLVTKQLAIRKRRYDGKV